MEKNVFAKLIATALNLQERAVANTLALLEEGCTIPFISRYRKERTGGLDEVQIAAISDRYDKLKEMAKRKETVTKTITDLGKMTPELQQRIDECWDANILEDIYLPYKPKRRTRAQVAREQGLEPLALILLAQRERDPERAAERYVKGDIKDVETALKGAQDIIAETVSEDERSRQQLRNAFARQAVISSKVVKAAKAAVEREQGKARFDAAEREQTRPEVNPDKYSDYFDWSEPLKRCSSHRLLAMRRGEDEGILRVTISPNDEEAVERLKRHYVYGNTPCGKLVAEAIDDGYKRLLKPAIETEYAALSKEKADEEAIRVFAENLRQLLLGAPLGQKRVMGIDPGFRTGCKVVCLDAQGNLLHHEAIFPHPPVNKRTEAAVAILKMVKKYQIEAISIGNGTASRETDHFVKDALAGKYNISPSPSKPSPSPQVFVVSESGASVYSASKIARDEFPDEDVTVRGAVSIGRRLMDPLAELVKIDPKSIGVGQYQHDVDQTKLKHSLDQTVESCVNSVGVNLNTASQHLLMYVSGLGPTLAKNIVDYRKEHGPFASRAELKKVPRLGPAAYQQCAGFLRIPGAKNPLDNSAVHPESYPIVEQMAKDHACSVTDLINNKEKREAIDIKKYVTAEVGIPTLTDIMKELEKPGRDPREQLEEFEFDKNVTSIDDLKEGMILPGIVTNITNFGAFVDIGVHQDGLIHISQMSSRRIAHPLDVVKLHQHVQVRVMEVDLRRNRISLSLKGI